MAARVLFVFLAIFFCKNDICSTVGSTSPAPAPTPTPEPQPSDFSNPKQYQAYNIIQRFKRTITCDPNNVTSTWIGARPCTYRGFYCDTPPGSPTTPTIAVVDFNGFGLCAPTIAGFIDALPDIALFHANSNNFSGTIPLAIAVNLPYLAELDVSNNLLSGPFPSAAVLPLAGNLTFLDVRFNSFSGAIPNAIFNIGLDALFINNNLFSTQLSLDFSAFTAAYLVLANNGFTGQIPRSISKASETLIEALLLNNKFSGCLPYEVGLLRNAVVFDAGFNQVTGPLPLSFGCLRNIEQLSFAGNRLYGHIPDIICMLPNILNLSLAGNYFTSMGPSCWTLWRARVLDVRRNCLGGFPGQRSPMDCARFFAVPKFCPFVSYIPCSLHYTGSDDGKAVPSPPFQMAPEQSRTPRRLRAAAEAPAYVSYAALHRRRLL